MLFYSMGCMKFCFKGQGAKNGRFTAVPNRNTSKSATVVLFVLILNKL